MWFFKNNVMKIWFSLTCNKEKQNFYYTKVNNTLNLFVFSIDLMKENSSNYKPEISNEKLLDITLTTYYNVYKGVIIKDLC